MATAPAGRTTTHRISVGARRSRRLACRAMHVTGDLDGRPASTLRPVEHPPRRASLESVEPPRCRFTIVAPPGAAAAALARLPASRHSVTVAAEVSSLTSVGDATLVVLDGPDDRGTSGFSREVPWIAWNRTGSDAVALRAYEKGARVVLPADLDGQALLAALERMAAGERRTGGGARGRRSYPEGSRIALGDDQVLRVVAGVVAQRVIHADGTHVLIGLFGSTRIVVGHPDDSCCLDLVAHTDVDVTCERWDESARAPGFAQALRVRLRQMEAWAAAQARPHLDERLLGVLSVLAEQFGQPHPRGLRTARFGSTARR